MSLPFKEYSSTLSRYSDNNQLQAKQYKSILESELGQTLYQREFPTIGVAALGPLNANLPKYKNSYDIKVDKENVKVFDTFWNYKQYAGSIFTDWNSAGVSAVKEDVAVSTEPLFGHIEDPTLVLSNTNNVRNNFINYGKEYLTTTNMLNAEAFSNGVSFETGGTSPFRTGNRFEVDQILHGNFENQEDGDLYSRQIKQLRVDLPINYANTTMSSWNFVNPICIIPNDTKYYNGEPIIKVFHEQIKYGIFDLDSMKLIGESCLTKEFNMTPQGFNTPQDVYNDRTNYPPVENINYYKPGRDYFKKDGEELDDGSVYHGSGSCLYCSSNTNYVTMPKNYVPRLAGLDTSFQVLPGTNSITLGTVMSPHLKDFIQNDLYKLNRTLVVAQIYDQESKKSSVTGKTPLMIKIEKMYPHLFLKHAIDEKMFNINYYNSLPENQKYKYVFNLQRNFASVHQGHPELETFLNHLSIFKFGGSHQFSNEIGKVRLSELSTIDLEIEDPGCFTLLPTMLSDDLFKVREEIPERFTGSVKDINSKFLKDPIEHHKEHGNSCISQGDNYQTNATNCAFRDKSKMWQQKPMPGDRNPNFVPNMFNDPNNLNNDIYNLTNPFAGTNPYNAPSNF